VTKGTQVDIYEWNKSGLYNFYVRFLSSHTHTTFYMHSLFPVLKISQKRE
jgi:hypothetical protein